MRALPGDDRVSAAARADYARAAAAVLADEDSIIRVYELAGDTAFTLPELAAVAAEASGKPLVYQDLAPDAIQAAPLAAGVPALFARVLSDTDAGLAKGALDDDSRTLARLIGRPTTPMATTITHVLQHQHAMSAPAAGHG